MNRNEVCFINEQKRNRKLKFFTAYRRSIFNFKRELRGHCEAKLREIFFIYYYFYHLKLRHRMSVSLLFLNVLFILFYLGNSITSTGCLKNVHLGDVSLLTLIFLSLGLASIKTKKCHFLIHWS